MFTIDKGNSPNDYSVAAVNDIYTTKRTFFYFIKNNY